MTSTEGHWISSSHNLILSQSFNWSFKADRVSQKPHLIESDQLI